MARVRSHSSPAGVMRPTPARTMPAPSQARLSRHRRGGTRGEWRLGNSPITVLQVINGRRQTQNERQDQQCQAQDPENADRVVERGGPQDGSQEAETV